MINRTTLYGLVTSGLVRFGLITASALTIALTLSACQPAQDNQKPSVASRPAPTAPVQTASAPMLSSQSAKPLNSIKKIDWTLIDSGVARVNVDEFAYPFTLDSAPVKAYMDAYQVDAKTARYNLTVGMAVNEVLNKVLDQIGTAYVSHELTAGKSSKFIVHTTSRIAPSQHDYIFAEPFAKGLTIPVEIINDGEKTATNAQTMLASHPQ